MVGKGGEMLELLSDERKAQIIEILNDNGSVSVRRLTSRFEVSPETIRGDMIELEKKNLLRRVHGGAISISSSKTLEELNVRVDTDLELKQEVAENVLRHIEDGDIISIDSGSTGIEIAKKLVLRKKRLTIITNSVDVMNIIGQNYNNTIIFLGGLYCGREKACYGDIALQTLKQLHISKAFVSPSAINKRGIYVTATEFHALIKGFITEAETVFITATSSKFHATAPILLSALKKNFVYITDKKFQNAPFWDNYTIVN